MIVQELVFPSLNFNTIEDMYFRPHNKLKYLFNEEKFIFEKGGILLLDTYVNSFNIKPWKLYSPLADLAIVIQGDGKFILRVGLHKFGAAHRWLLEEVIELNISESKEINIFSWNELDDGLLYCKLEAITPGHITKISYKTNTKPVNNVKLGVIITHYNRQKNVLKAIKRFEDGLFNKEEFKTKIDLIIIDNSRNLDIPEHSNVKVIKSSNLGGSGGFAKGLLYLEENDYTHALFMDDDASTEMEAIKRTLRLFEYSKIKKMAVAGALHLESNPHIIYEKGARFEGICKPVKHRLEILNINNLVFANYDDLKIDYGGWWFFAFEISDVEYMPFPFFVRGDDILFSILNKFNICTSIGIYCLGEDFGEKETPLHVYLDIRYHIINSIFKGINLFKIILYISYIFLKRLHSYKYESAKAANYAIKCVIKGPEFFIKNIDMLNVRNYINSFIKEEKVQEIDLNTINFDYPDNSTSFIIRLIKKLLVILTLNGFLIPNFLLKDKIIYQHRDFHANIISIFRFKKVLYYSPQDKKGYILRHNKVAYFKELFTFALNIAHLIISYPFLKRAYKDNIKYMTSKSFWKSVFDNYKNI